MGMRGEIRDFLTTAMAVHKMVGQDENDRTRNEYYKALINRTNSQGDLEKRRLDIYKQSLDDQAANRRASLGLQAQGLKQRQGAIDQSIKESNWRMDPNNPRNAGALPPTNVNPQGNYRYNNSDPAFNGGPTSAVPNNPEDFSSPPPASSPPSSASAEVTGYQPSEGNQYDYDASIDGDNDTENFARGGAVGDDGDTPDIQHHDAPASPQGAAKGAISDDDNDDQQQTPAQPSQPQNGGGAKNSGGFDVKSVLQSWGVGGGAGNPVKLGMDAFVHNVSNGGNGAVPDENAGQSALKDIHQNKGAATDQEVNGMNKAVDPDNELDDSAKTIARLDAGVKFWLARGETQKAQKVAQSLILYGKLQAQKFGQQAADALKKGDTQGALSFLTRAYDQVPDGQKLQANLDDNGQIHAQTTDADGNVRDLGQFGEAQVARLVLGARSGVEYMNRMAHIAGGTRADAQPGQQGGGGAMKPQDFQKTVDSVTGAFEDFSSANKMQLEPATASAVKNVATHMMVDPNNRRSGMTPNEAVSSASMLAAPDPKNPDQPNFKAQPVQGGVFVKFQNGTQSFVPKPQFDQLMALRAAQVKTMKDKADQDSKPGFVGGLVKTVNDARDKNAPAQAEYMAEKRKGRQQAVSDYARQGSSDEDEEQAAGQ